MHTYYNDLIDRDIPIFSSRREYLEEYFRFLLLNLPIRDIILLTKKLEGYQFLNKDIEKIYEKMAHIARDI